MILVLLVLLDYILDTDQTGHMSHGVLCSVSSRASRILHHRENTLMSSLFHQAQLRFSTNLGASHESSCYIFDMLLPTRTKLGFHQVGEHQLSSCHLVQKQGFHGHSMDKLHSPRATHAPQFRLDYILRFLMNLSYIWLLFIMDS